MAKSKSAPAEQHHEHSILGGAVSVPCILVSIAYIVLTMFLAEASRKLIAAVLPVGRGGKFGALVRVALLEFVAAAEMCGCGFELIIVADHYGVSAYAVFLFLLTIWWSRQWGEATACPYLQLEEVTEGKMEPVEAIVRTTAATVGGLAVFRYVQFLWDLGYAETHSGRSHSSAFGHCSADLQVPVFLGAVIEGVAVLLCRLTSRFLADSGSQHAEAIDSFVATSLVIAAFDYSGGYYNPVLATSLKFGCRGHTNFEHVAVYWAGASLGAVASVFVYPMLVKPWLAEERSKKED